MSDYSDLKFDWCGEVLADVGYGIQSRRILKPLLEGGADVKLIPNEPYIPEERKVRDNYWITKILESEKKPDSDIRVNFSVPQLYRSRPEALNIGYTMWETTRYPREWVSHINKTCGRFWTGSKALVQSALDGGVEVPVDHVTSCLDLTQWTPGKPYMNFSDIGKDDIVFMYVASWIPRKNFVDLLTAFCCEFDGQKDVALVIKTWGFGNPDSDLRDKIRGALQSHMNGLRGIGRPKINLITDVFPEEVILKMLRRADVYTSPSHGEGFDLPLTQAMACGCLPVVNNFLAHSDYCTEENSLIYNHTLKPVYGERPPYDAYQMWSVPDIGDYMEKLREAYDIVRDDKDRLRKMTDSGRKTIIDHYSPEKNADRVADLLRDYTPKAVRKDSPSAFQSIAGAPPIAPPVRI